MPLRSAPFPLVLGLSLLAGPPEKPLTGQMIQTGEFHGDEAPANHGERWLALILDPSKRDRIASVTVRVKRVWDAIIDEPKAKTGKKIAIPEGTDGVFLFRGIPSIRPHPVETVSTMRTLKPNAPVDLVLSTGRVYRLTLECSQPEGTETWQHSAASLLLQCGDQKQVLGTFQAAFEHGKFAGVGSEGETRLLWAGDLNGDGALDLIIDMTDHYNVGLSTLFLGNTTNAAELVAKAAEHRTTGC